MVVPTDVCQKLVAASKRVDNLAIAVHDNQVDAASLCKVFHHFSCYADSFKMLPMKGRGVFEFFPGSLQICRDALGKAQESGHLTSHALATNFQSLRQHARGVQPIVSERLLVAHGQPLHLQFVVNTAADTKNKVATSIIPPDLVGFFQHKVILSKSAFEKIHNSPHALLLRGLLPKQLAHFGKLHLRIYFDSFKLELFSTGIHSLLSGRHLYCQFRCLVHLFSTMRQAPSVPELDAFARLRQGIF